MDESGVWRGVEEEEEEIELVQPTGAIEVGWYVIVAVVGRVPGKAKGTGYWERT